MPQLYPIQPAFSGGEVSPRVAGRVDLDLYKTALSLCRNCIATPQGSLLLRSGSEMMRALEGTATGKRLIPFRLSDEQDYFLLFGHNTLQIFDSDGVPIGSVGGSSSRDLVVNGDFEDGLVHWTTIAGTVQIDGIGGNFCRLATAGAKIRQSLTALVAGVHTLSLKVKWVASTLAVRVRVGTTPGGTEIHDGTYHGTDPVDLTNPLDGITFVTVNVNVAAPGTIYVDLEAAGAAGGVQVDDVSIVAPETAGGTVLTTPWTAALVEFIHHDTESGADRMFFACKGNVKPYTLRRSTGGTWTFSEAPFVNPPVEWLGGEWPETVAYHDGRTWWARGNRFWASRAYNPVSGAGGPFDITVGANPGDAIDAKAATAGAIRWIRGRRELLTGTDLGEHSISGSGGTPLVGDFYVRDEDGVGSSRVQAVDSGPRALHVSGDGRQIRALAFNDQVGWNSEDVTFFAEHITKPGVKELHFTRTPEPTILIRLGDGTIAGCTWEARQKVVAWWRVEIAQGVVRTAAVSRGPAGAWLWMVVERAAGAFLERLSLNSRNGVDEQYLDAHTSNVADAYGNVWAPHLAGLDVVVMVGGAVVHAAYHVADDGGIGVGLEYAGATVVVGLPFKGTAKTLPLEGGNPAGTSQGWKVHFTLLSARLNNSARPLMNGARLGNGRPFETPLDAAEALHTGDFHAKSLTVEEGGVITIEMDLPYRTEVCAVYAQASVTKV